VADDVRKLLDYIVAHYVVRDELKSIDLDAPAQEPGAVIEADKKEAVRREEDRADSLADAFARALALARGGHSLGQTEVVLDDRDPEQDRMADALIRFLVSHDLAASRTDETEPQHYLYHVAVDWDRLGEVARAADVDLDRALRR